MSGEYFVSDWLTQNGFYLPSASSLTDDTIRFICEVIRTFHKE
jgi:perosamine synthetase